MLCPAVTLDFPATPVSEDTREVAMHSLARAPVGDSVLALSSADRFSADSPAEDPPVRFLGAGSIKRAAASIKIEISASAPAASEIIASVTPVAASGIHGDTTASTIPTGGGIPGLRMIMMKISRTNAAWPTK